MSEMMDERVRTNKMEGIAMLHHMGDMVGKELISL